jgi:hypothetical protein
MEDMTARAQELSEMAVAMQRTTNRFILGDEDIEQQTKMSKRPTATDVPRNPKRGKIKKNTNNQNPELSKKVKESLKKRGIDIEKEEEESDLE